MATKLLQQLERAILLIAVPREQKALPLSGEEEPALWVHHHHQRCSLSLLSDCLTLVSTPARQLQGLGPSRIILTSLHKVSHNKFVTFYSRATYVNYIVPSPIVTVSSDPSLIQTVGTNVIIFCTVELGPAMAVSDLPLVAVDARLVLNKTRDIPTIREQDATSFTYTAVVRSFQLNDSGEYVCRATVSPQSPSPYITGTGTQEGTAFIGIGM